MAKHLWAAPSPIPVLLRTICVTLGEWFDLRKPQFTDFTVGEMEPLLQSLFAPPNSISLWKWYLVQFEEHQCSRGHEITINEFSPLFHVQCCFIHRPHFASLFLCVNYKAECIKTDSVMSVTCTSNKKNPTEVIISLKTKTRLKCLCFDKAILWHNYWFTNVVRKRRGVLKQRVTLEFIKTHRLSVHLEMRVHPWPSPAQNR